METRDEHIEKLFDEMRAQVQSISTLARLTVESKTDKPLDEHNKSTVDSIVTIANAVIDVARDAARKGAHPLDIIVGLATGASVVNKKLSEPFKKGAL